MLFLYLVSKCYTTLTNAPPVNGILSHTWAESQLYHVQVGRGMEDTVFFIPRPEAGIAGCRPSLVPLVIVF